MRMIVLALALVAVAVQERDLPAGHYCMNHTPAPSQRNAHGMSLRLRVQRG